MAGPIMAEDGLRGTQDQEEQDDGISLIELAIPLVEHWKLLVFGPLLAGVAALGITYLIAPTFTARTTFLPPQQQQSAAASALASLGVLSSIAGAAANVKSPVDQYVSLMQSTTVADRLIDEFKLIKAYDVDYRFEARKELVSNSRIAAGKKDGMITVEVDDTSPERASAVANRYIDELRRMTNELALTDAQQRRAFFEEQLKQTRDRLATAQQALQASGFNQGALRAEPKAAAESYARARAEVTAAEIRLQALRRSLADSTPEVQREQAVLAALRIQLAQAEGSTDLRNNSDYVGKFREFKYQETLYELFSRQYELARLDESREGALIQVVDVAMPPELKSRPKRALIATVTTGLTMLFMLAFIVIRHGLCQAAADPSTGHKLDELRAAFRRGRPV